jgi:hypothetical protein
MVVVILYMHNIIRTQSTFTDVEEQLFMVGLETHYSARDIEARILSALRTVGLDPEQGPKPEQLGALDHFHTGGFKASRELQELAQIRAEDRMLDIGAELTGTARMLAHSPGCHALKPVGRFVF